MKNTTKNTKFVMISLMLLSLVACVSDKHALTINPQKVMNAVSAKYSEGNNTLVFIEAPDGFISPRLANCAIEDGVDNANVVAISSALALKSGAVIVAGEDESLTASTLAQALKTGKEKINGGKVVLLGAKETQKALADLATASGVTLEFMDNPA